MRTEATDHSRAFDALCQALGWRNEEIADELGVRTDSVRKWRKGTSRIPPGVDEQMVTLVAGRLAELTQALAAYRVVPKVWFGQQNEEKPNA